MYILPFDHRSTFSKKMFGFKGKLSNKEIEKISAYKKMVFSAFKKVFKDCNKTCHAQGILCDEQFGEDILKEAKKMGIVFAMSTEKSGKEIYTFEYGASFGKHLLKFKPTMAKALVRYNPVNREVNRTQRKRLKKLSDFCKHNAIQLMIEPLVIPTERQLKKYKGDKLMFDKRMRADLTVKMMREMYKEGIDPFIWKIEAAESQKDWKKIIRELNRRGTNQKSKIILLGRGADMKKVKEWFKLAAPFKEDIIGFAVGRTVFWKPLEDYRDKKIKKKEAIEKIAKNYRMLINTWEKLHQPS